MILMKNTILISLFNGIVSDMEKLNANINSNLITGTFAENIKFNYRIDSREILR